MLSMMTGVVLATLVITLSYGFALWPVDDRNAVYNRVLQLWSRVWLWAAGVRLRIVGGENIDALGEQSFFLAANHQSALDIPALSIATRGRARFAAKKSLFKIPIIGWWMSSKGYTPIDRDSARRSLPALLEMLERVGDSGVGQAIFPESTRTLTGKVDRFRPGAFRLMKRADLPVVPAAISGAYDALPTGSWRPREGRITIHVGPAIPADEVKDMPRDELMRRVRSFILQYVPGEAQTAESNDTDGSDTPAPSSPAEQPA